MTDKNVRDMTVGNPLQHILLFTLPLLLGNLFQQFYNMVDSIVVGNYVGANALAAVGACGSLNFLCFSLMSGLGVGIGVVVSQHFGAGDKKNVQKTIANSVYILCGMAIIMSIVGVAMAKSILQLLQTPEHIIGDSVIYLRTTCAGVIFISVYNGIAAMLRALGDSKTPLYFLIVASVVNVVLDLLFVLQFEWGVFGVALATIIAQGVSAVGCIIYAYKKLDYFHLTREQMAYDADIVRKSFRMGMPIAFQNALIAISCTVLQGVVNTFGETVMASYTIIGRIEQVVQQPYMSLGTALTTYTGQNVGAGKKHRVKQGFRQATLMVFVFSLCLIPVAYIWGEEIIGIFVKEKEVIEMGAVGLRINSLCYFALGMIYVPRAVLNGCGDTGFAMINGATEVACRVAFSHILTSIPVLGYWGIWLTTGATWVTTAVVCTIRYLRSGWNKVASKQP